MKRPSLQRGMTLLEILVALTIFILMAGAGYSGLQQGLAIQDSLQHQRQYWRRLDTVMTLLQQDLDQARDLAPRMPLGTSSPFAGSSEPDLALEGEILLFTRGGHASFSSGIVSPYLRIAYRIRDGILYRVTWPRLNMPEDEQGTEAELINNVTDIQLLFLDPSRQWTPSWPRVPVSSASTGLPEAVQLIVKLDNQNTYERVFHVGTTN